MASKYQTRECARLLEAADIVFEDFLGGFGLNLHESGFLCHRLLEDEVHVF
jgi:hypothetical protein